MTERSITTGTSESFKTLISDEFIYVDKTGPISALARQKGSFLLTRPRRMGKSTMISTLEYLFSNGAVTAKDLAWNDQWTEPYRYFVFHFDFSRACNDESESSIADFKSSIRSDLKDYADYFGFKLPKEKKLSKTFIKVILESVEKLSDKSFLAAHPELAAGERPLRQDKVVLLIDEYDAPLTEVIDDSKEFDKLRAQYKALFKAIKTLTCFRFVFITGVSSYAQTSIFSGANQFINISLDSYYATCCGYTRSDLERYFASELDQTQQILKLETRKGLFDALGYYYDGYMFSDDEDSYTSDSEDIRVFNPVSISLFLSNPKRKFKPYWGETGGNSTFIYKLLEKCTPSITCDLIKKLYPDSLGSESDIDPQLIEYVDSWYPIFTLGLKKNQLNQEFSRLIKVPVSKLLVKIEDVEVVTPDKLILILFQAGYLSIKYVEDESAYLGFANYEAAKTLVELLKDQIINPKLSSIISEPKEIFSRLHEGSAPLADFINKTLNLAPWQLFAKHNHEEVVTFVVYLPLYYAGIAAAREVSYVSGRADLVVYQPKSTNLIEDVVIEFKLAREGDDITAKIEDGSKQIIDRNYGNTSLNSHPLRYCIVISNELRQVAAISKIKDDATGYDIVYKSPNL